MSQITRPGVIRAYDVRTHLYTTMETRTLSQPRAGCVAEAVWARQASY